MPAPRRRAESNGLSQNGCDTAYLAPQMVRTRMPAVAGIHSRFIDRMIAFLMQPWRRFAEEVFSALQQQGIKIALNTGFTRAVADKLIRISRRFRDRQNRIDPRVICENVNALETYPDLIRARCCAWHLFRGC